MKFWIVFILVLATGSAERGGHAVVGFMLGIAMLVCIIAPIGKRSAVVDGERVGVVQHIKRHGARMGAAGFFWTLAAYHSLRRGSMEPLLRHAEWRATWRLARSV